MKQFKIALLFTGHMIDLPHRPEPRFPPEFEQPAKDAIQNEIALAVEAAGGPEVGIASGARGGDILFLEACREAGIPVRMVLPFAPAEFLETSVRGIASGDWESRFHRLWDGLAAENREVLTAPADVNVYDYCNRRMLQLSQELADRTRLIALWDGKGLGQEPGGTATFVAMVQQADGDFTHIDTGAIGRAPSP